MGSIRLEVKEQHLSQHLEEEEFQKPFRRAMFLLQAEELFADKTYIDAAGFREFEQSR